MSINLALEPILLSSLVHPPYNPRRLSKDQERHLTESLTRFGPVDPVVVNRRNHHVVGGNQRVLVARKLGWDTFPAVYVDLDDERERELNVRLNANTGEWDLAKLLAEFQLPDLTEWGLSSTLLQELTQLRQAAGGGLTDPDDIPEPLPEAVTRPGDLWLLGDHRLLCGDSAAWEDVARLTENQPVQLVNTDPPYNVRVEPRSKNAIAAGLSSFAASKSQPGLTHNQKGDLARHPGKAKATSRQMRAKDRPLANDFLPAAEFEDLLGKWFANLSRALAPGHGFYLWGGFANCANYPPAMKAAGLYFSQALIWVKGHPVLARKDYLVDHEWCFYGWREGAAHRFFGPNTARDVWDVKKVTPQKMVHLTEKPVELAERAIEYSSLPGERVLDLFGGSGSTLIACERTGRRALLMEMDPHYCDVIVRRWENYTGRKAERAIEGDAPEIDTEVASPGTLKEKAARKNPPPLPGAESPCTGSGKGKISARKKTSNPTKASAPDTKVPPSGPATTPPDTFLAARV